MNQFFVSRQGRRLAYDQLIATDSTRVGQVKKEPGIVFLGGFNSDMMGTKAAFLREWAQNEGRAFLRFDYSGHGSSSGSFKEGSIENWFEDAFNVVTALTEGPQILVGSSMGGWISLLLAKSIPNRIAGIVGVAVAPDFTEDSFWKNFSLGQREALLNDGEVEVYSSASHPPYVVTRQLIENGRKHLVLRDALNLPFPVRLLHGTHDLSVPVEVPLRLMSHANCPDMRLTLIKDADHSLSTPDCLNALAKAIKEITDKDI